MSTAQVAVTTKKDWTSDQEVRWCPGCGDYGILLAVQTLMPELGIAPENTVFISGIGCSSRFPYYMNTYGMHSIHGRAPAIATGLAVARPDLDVWVITGDGDGLSIGGNHLIHALRRNVNLNILLFNNRIYGLTKGQYSPTSEMGKKAKSTPFGSVDRPFSPLALALGAGATFIARSVDVMQPHLKTTLKRVASHKGTAFTEILQNCNIFNDGAWEAITEKDVRDDGTIAVEHGKPLVFGKNKNQGIRQSGFDIEVVTLGEGASEADLLVHNERHPSPAYAYMLASMDSRPGFPTPVGVLRAVDAPAYEDSVNEQVQQIIAKKGRGDLGKLLHGPETWEIK